MYISWVSICQIDSPDYPGDRAPDHTLDLCAPNQTYQSLDLSARKLELSLSQIELMHQLTGSDRYISSSQVAQGGGRRASRPAALMPPPFRPHRHVKSDLSRGQSLPSFSSKLLVAELRLRGRQGHISTRSIISSVDDFLAPTLE
jgi:hypothetical protein